MHEYNKDLVLIVDDSPDTLNMLNDVLEEAGMDTLVALEGQQAISIARKMLPDIILLDAVMPNMDGFTVCQQMKQDPELRSIPVIFMTGLSDTESVVRGFNVGGIDYITKPIQHNELIARMRVHLANNRVALSAQSALDIAGQYMFAVDSDGNTLWSTPQVKNILEQDNHINASAKEFCLDIKTWLAHQPSPDMTHMLKLKDNTLKLTYLGKASSNEYLMRLSQEGGDESYVTLKSHWQLTDREAEVLYWISKGKTNREIGQIIGASPRTINKHSENLYKKLGVENRTTAATMAIEYLQH